jgi:peptidyl-dipeptidase Dcp
LLSLFLNSSSPSAAMSHFHLSIVCLMLNLAQITAVLATDSPNPLLTESTLPYHVPPFDKIKDEHFIPAMESRITPRPRVSTTLSLRSNAPAAYSTGPSAPFPT